MKLFIIFSVFLICQPTSTKTEADPIKEAIEIIKELVDVITRQDEDGISDLLSETYQFHTCDGREISKDIAIKLFSTVPKGTEFNISLLASKFVGKRLVYNTRTQVLSSDLKETFYAIPSDSNSVGYLLIGGQGYDC